MALQYTKRSSGIDGMDDMCVDSSQEFDVDDQLTNYEEDGEELELETAGTCSPTTQSDRFSIP